MKIITILNKVFLSSIFVLVSVSVFGQELSVKELKKEKKSLSVQEFKIMIEQEKNLKKVKEKIRKTIIREKETQKIEALRIKQMEEELKIIEEELQELKKQYEYNNPVPTEEQVEAINEQEIITHSGVYFKIQIGAFLVKNSALFDDMVNICKTKDIDLRRRKIYINRCMDEYFSSDDKFDYEGHKDGSISRDQTNEYKKYLIGYFPDYWEADNFKRLLRSMGVDKAWIVPYVDDTRVELEWIIEKYPHLIFGPRKEN